MKQFTRYCTTRDGVRIAYASIGKGPPIVRTSHWLTHLDHDLQSPVWRHVILGFAKNHTLIRYDARGEGRSQRDDVDISFAGWLEDLRAVVDAAGLERFSMFGASQGAATAIAFAAANPERVDRLILYGGFARGIEEWQSKEEFELARALVRQGWGEEHPAYRQWFTSTMLPEGSAEQYQWFNRLQEVSATADVAERHVITSGALDVTDQLARVRAPTLVLHARGDIVAPYSMGEELAAGIPDATFVELPGANHLFLPGSPAHRSFFEHVNEFLGDPPPPRHLPGTTTLHERLGKTIGGVESNWLIKLILIAGGAIGLLLSLEQLWEQLQR